MPVENEHFVAEALRIVEEAEAQGIKLRILGSLAYRIHCPQNLEMFAKMERALTDIDFAAEKRQSKQIKQFLTASGYVEDERMTVSTEGNRYYFEHPDTRARRGRVHERAVLLPPDPVRRPAGPRPADDLDRGPAAREDADRRAQPEGHHGHDGADARAPDRQRQHRHRGDRRRAISPTSSTTTGASTTRSPPTSRRSTGSSPTTQRLSPEQAEVIRARLAEMLGMIEDAPKSRKWRLRAKVGPKKQWYQDVAPKGSGF